MDHDNLFPSFEVSDECMEKLHAQHAHLVKISPPPFSSGRTLEKTQIKELIVTAFWASLSYNEGRPTRFSVAVADQGSITDAIAFAQMVPYDAARIEILAPASPPGGCLLVDASPEKLRIWGFGRQRGFAMDGISLEIPEPGTVRVGLGVFKTFAVFHRESMSVMEETGTGLQNNLCAFLQKRLPAQDFVEMQAVPRECRALAELGRMILNDSHGGTVLIVPGETGAWSDYLSPFTHRFARPDSALRDAIRQNLTKQFSGAKMLEELQKAQITDDARSFFVDALRPDDRTLSTEIRRVASLARVDGALVITKDLSVLGFGAKIAVDASVARKVFIFGSEPVAQRVALHEIETIGGTRHQSAARFIAQNREAVALVISQDRHMKIMHWWGEGDHVAVVKNAEWLV
jgi:hypothetical protein